VNGGKQEAGVTLGVLSGPLDSEYVKDITVSRIGGPPVWCDPSRGETSLSCKLCKAPLYLVAQIYAPFGGSRALHIFGCNSVKCSKNRGVCVCVCRAE
jgi:pre-rRNA-processing protein TSR4